MRVIGQEGRSTSRGSVRRQGIILSMDKLTAFLRGLDAADAHYTLGFYTTADVAPAAITVHVTASPDERWEVEFFEDGSVEIERFLSTGGVKQVAPESLLAELEAHVE